MRLTVGRTCSAKPASTPSGSLSRSHRETWATSGVSSRSSSSSIRRAVRWTSPTLPSSRSNTAPRPMLMVRRQPGRAQHRGDAGERHRLVLRRERVDRRRDQSDLGGVEALPAEALAREHVGGGRLDVWDQEPPCLAREVVGGVEPDVRAPDRRHPGLDQRRDHAGGLGIVKQHDVVRAAPARAAARRSSCSGPRTPRAPPRRAARRRRRSRAGGCAGASSCGRTRRRLR